MNLDSLLDNFATRSFRDIGDGDYIAARLAFRAMLIQQFLWCSLQAIEKYLKCILILNRIEAKKGHNLAAILQVFDTSKKVDLALSDKTRQFLNYLNAFGRHRYYEVPYYTQGDELLSLDQAVWEVRHYAVATNEAVDKQPPHRFSILGGRLEAIIADRDDPSREPLLWKNGFFGRRSRKTIKLPSRMQAGNSPLFLHPEILDEVQKYVYLPKDVIKAYRTDNLT